ncbi:hypothetical protein JYT96_03275, partial [Gammaproteobacteria bacterium AH-315-C21]|nr:hypothetical protein [Gammaproteobacteria bacterium AH-315-C21]
YWLPDKTEHTITELGVEPPADALYDGPPPPTFEEIQQNILLQVTSMASRTRAAVAENADQYKVAGWLNKEMRARRILDSTATAIDLTVQGIESAQRGKSETAEILAQKQLLRADALGQAVALIDGLEESTLEAVAAATTETAANAALMTLISTFESAFSITLTSQA